MEPRPTRRGFIGLAAGAGAAALGTAGYLRLGSTDPAVVPSTVSEAGDSASVTAAVTRAALPPPGIDPTDCTMLLGRGTDVSVALSLRSDTARNVVVHVADDTAGTLLEVGPRALTAGAAQTIEIEGLRPDRAYRYAVAFDGTVGAHHGFHTQRAPGSPFTFTVEADPHFGDPRFDGPLFRRALENARADRPDFHIDLGDLFMTEKSRPTSKAAAGPTFTGLRPYLQTVAAEAPLHLVNGNHEGELGWFLTSGNDRELPIWSTELRRSEYAVPAPGGFFSGASAVDPVLGTPRDSWYSFVWGDARIIVLDPFWYTRTKPKSTDVDGNWGWTLGAEQYEWLRRTLQANRSPYTFVMIHHLVGGGPDGRGGTEVAGRFEWGGRNADGSPGFASRRQGWELPVHDLLVRGGVSAVFHGHDHVYVAQQLDGIVYQLLPQPSNTSEDTAKLAAEYGYGPGRVVNGSGHLRVEVTPTKATVSFVRALLPSAERADRRNGDVVDRYEIAPARRG